ncbi:MAG: flagellar assembly protein FliX [Pseudomonadota bacterium]
MRIEGPKGPAASTKKRVSPSGGGFSLASGAESQSTDSAQTTAAPSKVAHMDALLALQSVDDNGDQLRRAVQKGHDLLDQLEALRADLLGGKVSPNRLRALVGLLNAPDRIDDPKLAAIIDDIALRARVELAKIGQD